MKPSYTKLLTASNNCFSALIYETARLQNRRNVAQISETSTEQFAWAAGSERTALSAELQRKHDVALRHYNSRCRLDYNVRCVARNCITATRYGPDGPGIESCGGDIFRTRPDRPWGPPSLLYEGHPVFFSRE